MDFKKYFHFELIPLLSILILINACGKEEIGNKNLKASFTVEEEIGDSPWKVKFTNTSSEDAVAFTWDFGDGTTSRERSPEHLFRNLNTLNPLTCNVKLYVQDNEMNADTFEKTITINKFVIKPPVFNPDLTYGTVSDIEGNIYKTIVIGSQTWMAENLRTMKYNTGVALEMATHQTDIEEITEGAFTFYNYDQGYAPVYGALYNIAAIESNICPSGWHVPNNADWYTLINSLGGSAVAGGKIKETGTSHWLEPNTGATNESGFTSLPGGTYTGYFNFIGELNCFWSSNRESQTYTYFTGQRCDTTLFDIGSRYAFDIYMSVRCVKD